MSFLQQYSQPQQTPQAQRANAFEVPNAAGGFVYAIDKWTQLDRFLVLGTQGGTYYASESKITLANLAGVEACLAEDGPRVVARVVEISTAARAMKQDYGLYVLAMATSAKDQPTRQAAYVAIGKVCRTGSTLFQFVSYLKGRRGWSRGLKAAIARWYTERPVDQLAYQMVKYGQRHGYTHRDLLRLGHPHDSFDMGRKALFRWALGKEADEQQLPDVTKFADGTKNWTAEGGFPDKPWYAQRLPREALPTEWLTQPDVWEALLYGEDGRGMPTTALIRNLGNLSKCGLLTAGSDAERYVVGELMNETRIRQSRIHPMAAYIAAKQYAQGAGRRGSGTWAPVGSVVDALENTFYLAFGNVEVTGKKILVAIDASGSMSANVLGVEGLSARQAGLALGLVTMRTEPNARLIGFTDGGHGRGTAWGQLYPQAPGQNNTTEFKVGGDERLRDVLARFNAKIEGRGTDLAEPCQWASKVQFDPDAIVVVTDSETWAGTQHPDQALAALRRDTRKDVKMIVVSTTATGTSIGDPRDASTLQVAGFDAGVPAIISGFVRGDF